MVRRKLKETVDDMLFVNVLNQNEPYNKVLTEFDDEYEEEYEN